MTLPNRLFWMMLPLFVAFGFCSRESTEGRGQLQEMVFEVDSTLIGDRMVLSEDSIVFHPPAGWEWAGREVMAAVQERTRTADDESGAFEVEPIFLFTDGSSMSILSVSRIHMRQDSLSDESFLNEYRSFVGELPASSRVQEDAFLKEGCRIRQFLIQDEARIVFKLLFKNHRGNWFQFDYIVFREEYPEEVEAIESSIGSIKFREEKEVGE